MTKINKKIKYSIYSISDSIISLVQEGNIKRGGSFNVGINNILINKDAGIILKVFAITKSEVRTVVISGLLGNLSIGMKFEFNSNNGFLKTPNINEFGRVYDVMGNIIYDFRNEKNNEIPKKVKIDDQFSIGENITKGIDYIDTKYSIEKDFKHKKRKYNLVTTGLRAIDFLFPILESDITSIFGGAGLGKTVLINELMNNANIQNRTKHNILTGIGERNREIRELIDNYKNNSAKSKDTTIFIAQMDKLPANRSSIIHNSLTFAEKQIESGKDVFLFIDNIYRHIQASTELSLSLQKRPIKGGYDSDSHTNLNTVVSRIISRDKSITSFQTVFVPQDDETDFVVSLVRSHTDVSLNLSRDQASSGLYPAINYSKSFSKNLSPKILGYKHYKLAKTALKYLDDYVELSDLVMYSGINALSEEERRIYLIASQLRGYFAQNMSSSVGFTGKKPVKFSIEKDLPEIEEILSGKYIDIPWTFFIYVNSVQEALDNYNKATEEIDNNDIKEIIDKPNNPNLIEQITSANKRGINRESEYNKTISISIKNKNKNKNNLPNDKEEKLPSKLRKIIKYYRNKNGSLKGIDSEEFKKKEPLKGIDSEESKKKEPLKGIDNEEFKKKEPLKGIDNEEFKKKEPLKGIDNEESKKKDSLNDTKNKKSLEGDKDVNK